MLGPVGVHFESVLRLCGLIECKFASDRPQVGPKSAHKQIKHIWPRDFRMASVTLTSLWHHLEVTLGSLWDHFEVTLGSLLAYEGDSGAVWYHLAITVESLWVYKGPLSKNIIFLSDFNGFIKCRGMTCRIENEFRL